MAKKKTVKKAAGQTKKTPPKQQVVTTEQLAFQLNQCYTQVMQAQGRITAINKEIERRQKAKELENG